MYKQQLIRELHGLCVNADADISVLWREPGANADEFAFEPEKIMASASMIKLPIMLAALSEVQAGRLSLKQRIAVHEQEILDGSIAFDAGNRDMPLEELITWMIITSDNTATNVIIELLGMDAVNGYCGSIGIKNTVLRRKMLDFDAAKRGRDNTATARDISLMYFMLDAKKILTPELCETAVNILKKQRIRKCLPRYIWEDVELAHKTGGLDYLTHDAGIFYVNERKYYLGVFLQNCKNIEGNPGLIGKISRFILDYYLEGQT